MERRMKRKVSRTVWSRGKAGDYIKGLPIAIRTFQISRKYQKKLY